MTPIPAKHQAMLQSISRQHPALREFIAEWRTAELDRMAAGSEQTFGTQKGRVQLLTELQQYFSPATP